MVILANGQAVSRFIFTLLCYDKFFLVTDTQACEKFVDLINNPRLLKDVKKLSTCHQTSKLESFHSLDFALHAVIANWSLELRHTIAANIRQAAILCAQSVKARAYHIWAIACDRGTCRLSDPCPRIQVNYIFNLNVFFDSA